MRLVCIIPARIGSTRLHEKPLRLLGGEPLVRVVARRAREVLPRAEVVVATDDRRVIDAVAPLGVPGVLTDPAHRSGTDRVAEVAALPDYQGADIVINVQGDEPFLSMDAAHGAVARVRLGDHVGTAARPLRAGAARDPHRVKVTVDGAGRAVAFYRRAAVVPRVRRGRVPLEHIGLYAYTPVVLQRWVRLPPGVAEVTESLEQLRALEAGMTIGVAVVRDAEGHGIDTEADLRLAEAMR